VGYLAWGESRIPRWIAICVLLAGASVLASAILTPFAYSLAETIGYIYFLAWIVWSVAMWRWFLKTAAA